MEMSKRLGALDCFRVIAALLVIANHTSPLADISATGDFVLTRAIARLAVPFFFTCSGFFLHAAEQGAFTRLLRFTKKNAALYLLAVALYLPLNLYMGSYSLQYIPQFLADLLWNGTLYHLWFFPALLVGMWVAFGLRRYLPRWLGLGIAALLYIAGALADTYQAPFMEGVYSIFPTTQNGLFFAPLFLLLGMLLREAKPLPKYIGYSLPLWVGLLSAEALWRKGTMLHDSMYLALPFAAVSLFCLLCDADIAPKPRLRTLSLWVYLIHPWCIVLVRGLARAVPLLWYSPVFYGTVVLLSLALASLICMLPPLFKSRKAPARCEAAVDLDAIEHNLHAMRQELAPGCGVMAVVKANAYGHGALPAARRLQRAGVTHFAVATLAEGIALRRGGIRGEVLVLGYTPPQAAGRLWLYRLTQTLADPAHAAALASQGYRLRVQIKVDTGMHRLGFDAQDLPAIRTVYQNAAFTVTGIFSHLGSADSLNEASVLRTQKQTALFGAVVAALRADGISPGAMHLHASHGALNCSTTGYTYARLGLALYGAVDTSETLLKPELRPAMRLGAKVASVRQVRKGEAIGYGLEHTAQQDMALAALTLGYADGLPRAAENIAFTIRAKKAPLAGRVMMDQCIVDVTDIPGIQPGDEALLLGPGAYPAPALSKACGSIPNELLCRIGARVPRRFISRRANGTPFRCTVSSAIQRLKGTPDTALR